MFTDLCIVGTQQMSAQRRSRCPHEAADTDAKLWDARPWVAKLQDAKLQMRIHCQAADTDVRPWDAKLQEMGWGWGIALYTIIHENKLQFDVCSMNSRKGAQPSVKHENPN